MAFETLTGKLQSVFKKISKKGKVTEKDVKETMREVKLALLEADVNFLVVKDFIKRTSERATGQDVLESLTPGQQIIKIVNEELTALMGSKGSKLNTAPKPPTVILMAGLQGAGKTTMCAKLAYWLKKQGKSPLLAACDVYRPAAIDQLKKLGEKLQVPVFEMGQADPVKIADAALEHARKSFFDTVIIDTAGRLHIDEEMMNELKRVEKKVEPHNMLLVVDAMTGQDAVNAAKAFNDAVRLDGVILTKLDGDARGGAALSVRAVTGKPILFAGIGEKIEDIEPFHPERMASRILGMGDVLTLIEKAQDAFDEKKALELERRIKSQQFTLGDYLEQFAQMKKMGSITDVLGMIPGLSGKVSAADIDEKEIERMEAIIKSMTIAERENPSILNASRRRRIAAGSGTTIQHVNRLLNQFESTKKLMKQLTEGGKGGKKSRMRFPFM
ncbi:MAG: signal recognition particle protein [Bacillota bacterium]